MRKYTLASPESRSTVDLRDYRAIIESAVQEIMPAAKVIVEKDCYYVSPAPERGDAVKIGRLICKSNLNRHCIQLPKLFTSIPVKEVKHEEQPSKHSGGHQ
jgi:hypothetical protein